MDGLRISGCNGRPDGGGGISDFIRYIAEKALTAGRNGTWRDLLQNGIT
jgi:hypothetical protein